MSFKAARKNAGKTIESVAKEMGVSRQAVYLWETGKSLPSADKLKHLSEIYGCSIDELLR